MKAAVRAYGSRVSHATVAFEAGNAVGEGTLWDPAGERLLWVDIAARAVHAWHPGSGHHRVLELDERPTSLAPLGGGGFLLTLATGAAELCADLATPPRLRVPIGVGHPGIRVNDAKCDPAGRLWAGTMHEDGGRGEAALFRVDGWDAEPVPVLTGLALSNGLGWSPDGRTMYHVDTRAHGVDAYDFDLATGTPTGRRRLVDIDPADGDPDGLTVDAEGAIWLALWGGSAVRRYLPDGVLDRVVELPASQITNCTFGGPELRDLYVTSARAGLSRWRRVRERHAGAVFRVDAGVCGLEADAFAPA